MKKTSIKFLRKGQLFTLRVKQPDGSFKSILYKRGSWAGKVSFYSPLEANSGCKVRTDFYYALDPFTNSNEMLVSTSSDIWKI